MNTNQYRFNLNINLVSDTQHHELILVEKNHSIKRMFIKNEIQTE